MDAGTSSNSPAPFLLKTFEMVDDTFTNSVVSWSHSGHSFVVWNPPEFSADLLPNYFKHNNFSSFIRQLNTYGFRKVDPDLWEFANDDFVRGRPHLLNNIHRRKPIHTHTHTPLPDSDRDDFEKKIAKLKHEKARLQSEADRHRDESCRYVDQLRSLANTLQNIDQRQQQLVIVLSKLLDKPEHAAKLALLPENKKRRVVEEESTTENLGTVSLEVVERLTSTCEELAANYNSPAWYGDCRKSSKSESQSSVEESPRGGGNDVFWQQFLSEAPSAKKMGEGWNSEDSDCTEEGTGTAWGWMDKRTRQLGDLNPPPF